MSSIGRESAMRSVDNNTAENSQITGAADRSGGEMGHVSGQIGLNNTTMTLELIDKEEEKDFPEMFTKNLGWNTQRRRFAKFYEVKQLKATHRG